MAGITYEADDKSLVEKIRADAENAAKELVSAANLKKGNIVVVGCSTSETLGKMIGKYSVPEIGKSIYDGLASVFDPLGIYIAAQCCEHLNRAIIIEHSAVPQLDRVNVVPQPKAGGSFATACYHSFKEPVAVEKIRADAGMDIGDTLIGMHLKEVVVPVRLGQKSIGEAHLVCARTRPKFIGGERAFYDAELKNGYKY